MKTATLRPSGQVRGCEERHSDERWPIQHSSVYECSWRGVSTCETKSTKPLWVITSTPAYCTQPQFQANRMPGHGHVTGKTPNLRRSCSSNERPFPLRPYCEELQTRRFDRITFARILLDNNHQTCFPFRTGGHS